MMTTTTKRRPTGMTLIDYAIVFAVANVMLTGVFTKPSDQKIESPKVFDIEKTLEDSSLNASNASVVSPSKTTVNKKPYDLQQ